MTSAAEFRTESPPTPLHWASKVAMLTGGLAVTLTIGSLVPVLPKIDSALAHTQGDHLLVKLLVTGVGASMVVGAPVAGALMDRLGARPILLYASLLLTLAGTAGLYLDSLPALIVSRLFVGLAGSAIAATAMTLINSTFEGHERGKWMGAHVSLAAFGGLILQPAAGLLGEFGWRWPFALYFFGLPLAAIAMFGLDKGRPLRSSVANVAASQHLLAWFPIRFAVLAICIGSITYIPGVYLPFLMRQAGVSSPLLISLVGFADGVLTVIMAFIFGRLKSFVSSHAAFAFSFACTGIGTLIAATAPNVISVVAGMVVYGAGVGWFVPNLMTAAAKHVTIDQQGRTVGLIKAAHYAAAPLCTIVVEPLNRQLGPDGAVLAATGLSIVMLLLFGFQLAVRRRPANTLAQGRPSSPSM